MISAFLNGKLSSQQENMEDMLTSCVFDALRYSGSNRLLFKWLQQAQTTERHLPFENLDADSKVKIRFWPKLNAEGCYPCEPDVVLEIGEDDGYSILVEAKYRSGKSSHAVKEDEKATDQLAKEWDNLLGKLGEIDSNRKPYLIYLTADIGLPKEEIEKSIDNITTRKDEAKTNICWLSWRQLSAIMSSFEHPALDDLLKLLKRLKLVFYTGIAIDSELTEITWRFDRLDNLIWSRQVHTLNMEWRFKNET